MQNFIFKNRLSFTLAIVYSLIFSACQNKSGQESPEKPLAWEVVNTPTEASLRGISVVTSDIIWASGSQGIWLRSVDGGSSWSSGVVDGLDSVDFRSIHAFNAEEAIVVTAGQPARIYRTSDGGESWELKLEESEKAFFDGINFADEKRGYVFGDPVDGFWMIYQTLDAGLTWSLLDSLPQAEEGEAGFAASASSLLAQEDNIWLGSGGSYSNIHHSPDRGKTWMVHPSPLIQGESSQGIFSMTYTKKGELVAVGGDYLEPDSEKGNIGLFLTPTMNWSEENTTGPSGYRSGVQYFPRFSWLIAVGPNGSDFSKDGGKTWDRFSDMSFHAVSLSTSTGSIWASGPDGKIAKLLY
ncbi:YCF48-related protein [Algoriphagus sp. NF]|uniref:WD40/YVTN/BNR-like repeat-containing protein n=1 Tax=Algoriphagus sp. NF TaxID=2992756 RepID=UPI00237BD4BA|nr:YCF48-related protein [Algoriphagus sp. NF]MDE0560980.1 YCF48-related protein [Algoriphagus sp. NF]